MKWETEIPSPSSYHSVSSSNWVVAESKSSRWTASENKMFENALAVYDKDTPDRWHKVAAMIPGKTVGDVLKQYKELEDDVSDIEAGLIPIPGYITSPFTLEWVNNNDGFDGLKQSYGYGVGGKRSSNRPSDQERKKGVPWTEEEHKLFLMGLKKYGKGDWRNISRNFVITRTPTQVASHAQKYFIRQLSGGKDKRRASIHDITTVNLVDTRAPLPENIKPSLPDHAGVLPQQPSSGAMTTRSHFHWNQLNGGATMAFNAPHVSSSPYGLNPYGLKMQGPKSVQESYFGSQNLMQPSPPNPHSVTHKGRGEYF